MTVEFSALNEKEKELIELLTLQYEKFIEPSLLQKGTTNIKTYIANITPEPVKNYFDKSLTTISDAKLIVQTLEVAGRGFGLLQETAANMTLNKQSVITKLSKIEQNIDFESICKLRSYEIEGVLTNNKWKDNSIALIEGAGTGMFGVLGIPFNLALSMLLYYRAVQNVALMYGYDVKDDPRELEIASSVTMNCLFPNNSQTDDIMNVIGKMVLASNLNSLKKSLNSLTFKQMAEMGGAELLFVQIRALGNKAAEKALKEAGQKGLENTIFKKMLEQLGSQLSKEVGKKAIPILGALVGGLSDLYMMDRVLKGSNIIYHKRFLIEKTIRVNKMSKDNTSDILDYDEIMRKIR
ncbi:EcsC family protein [Niallia sp.]|uniref:EcsC family protein n=1 Tax=Niallia sp. TaxID=2837523 RepID=UPI002896FA68|nr:EcsC family protein [Niallia sp.]